MEHTSSTQMQSSILWQNVEQTVTLIDIPHSIAYAQSTLDQPCEDVLLSTEPRQTPYRTNEPKSAAAKANVANNVADGELHGQLAEILEQALEDVASNHAGAWCLPRDFVAERLDDSKKRKFTHEPSGEQAPEGTLTTEDVAPTELPGDILPSFAAKGLIRCHGKALDELDDAQAPDREQEHSAQESQGDAHLTLPDSSHPSSIIKFRLPPNSSFVLSSCAHPTFLHTAVRTAAQAHNAHRTFDFILLDPPWPNRSVKRTHKTANSTYTTSPTLYDIHDLISGTDLDVLMAHNCLVAVWITNKVAVRDLVLGEGGLFDVWGVELVEEWVWLKTTVQREPVTPLRTAWRKPYEVLLLGRKHASTYAPVPVHEKKSVERRVLVSVPDLHSRKPCVKELIGPLMPNAQDYRALEVFARHMVAGWWSWGDECIKYNWEGYWKKSPSLEPPEEPVSRNA